IALVERIAQLTGSDLAVSTDKTGAGEMGGDWVLEYSTGLIEVGVPFRPSALIAGGLGTFVVNSVDDKKDSNLNDGEAWTGAYVDDGYGTMIKECTLRAAIEQANGISGKDTITFSIPIDQAANPQDPDPHFVISPKSSLPTITDPVIINGYSQNGADENTNPLDQGNNAVLKIVLDGSNTKKGTDGLTIEGGNSEVRGLVIQNFRSAGTCGKAVNGFGIVLGVGDSGFGGGNVVEGNFIGTSVDGLTSAPNTSGIGVASPNNKIKGNVISGNKYNGIQIGGKRYGIVVPNVSENFVQSNYIGTTKDGDTKLGNGNGIRIARGADSTTIGGTAPGERNVLSHNMYQGILIDADAGGSHVIEGNFVGTDKTGMLRLGNGHGGIEIHSSDNEVKGNVISANGWPGNPSGCGVLIVGMNAKNNLLENNVIGTNAAGTKKLANNFNGVEIQNASENTVQSNLISGNGLHGVALFGAEAKFNTVSSNDIGTDNIGNKPLGNTQAGVAIFHGSENIIENNRISGNGIHGVYITGSTANENQIVDNKIGTNKAGDDFLANAFDGIHIKDAPYNFIGGANLAD
ncbi:MAG: right-handed parallel beta-helix repeat-containing protein, partial [Phycisphaerales bacterium]